MLPPRRNVAALHSEGNMPRANRAMRRNIAPRLLRLRCIKQQENTIAAAEKQVSSLNARESHQSQNAAVKRFCDF
jgi:hypothetical protein